MKVVLKPHEVEALYIGSYDAVYEKLQKIKSNIIFAERKAGAVGYQWLVDDGWCCLLNADEGQDKMVRAEIERSCGIIISQLNSETLSSCILTVPSDKYIYFKEISGGVEVLLVAWGHCFPEDRTIKPIHDRLMPLKISQDVSILFVYDGKPMALYPFVLYDIFAGQEMNRTTDENGIFYAGKIDVGTNLSFSIMNKSLSLLVEKAKDKYVYDLTEFVEIFIKVTKNDLPHAGECGNIIYNGRSISFATSEEGEYREKLPKSINQSEVSVEVAGMRKCRVLSSDYEEFCFDLTNYVDIVVRVTKDGRPFAGVSGVIRHGDCKIDFTTSALGVFRERFRVDLYDTECYVEILAQKQQKTVSELSLVEFNFEFEADPVAEQEPVTEPELITEPKQEKPVLIKLLDYKGKPLRNIEFYIITEGGKEIKSVTDENGCAEFSSEEFKDKEKTKIRFVVSKEYQKKYDLNSR